MRTLLAQRGASSLIEAAAKTIDARLRPAALAVAADIVLVDGRMERLEARFLRNLAADLAIEPRFAKNILGVIRIKNSV